VRPPSFPPPRARRNHVHRTRSGLAVSDHQAPNARRQFPQAIPSMSCRANSAATNGSRASAARRHRPARPGQQRVSGLSSVGTADARLQGQSRNLTGGAVALLLRQDARAHNGRIRASDTLAREEQRETGTGARRVPLLTKGATSRRRLSRRPRVLADKGSHATTGVDADQRAHESRARPERVARLARRRSQDRRALGTSMGTARSSCAQAMSGGSGTSP
jgi:hypothetical protein